MDMEADEMKNLEVLRKLFSKNSAVTAAATLAGAAVGAVLGVLTYYNGWLG